MCLTIPWEGVSHALVCWNSKLGRMVCAGAYLHLCVLTVLAGCSCQHYAIPSLLLLLLLLLSAVQAAKASAVPATVLPQLVGLLHTLPGGLTTIALQPCPLLLPSKSHQQRHNTTAAALESNQSSIPAAAAAECVLVGAGPTTTGHLAVFTVRRGLVNPLCPELLSALSVHKEVARGVRWLGPLPLLVSFSSERSSSGAWRNSLMITDVHAGHRCAQQHKRHPRLQLPTYMHAEACSTTDRLGRRLGWVAHVR